MKKIIVRLWTLLFIGIAAYYYPADTINKYVKESRSGRTITARLQTKYCPKCPETVCRENSVNQPNSTSGVYTYQSQDGGAIWVRQSDCADGGRSYAQGKQEALSMLAERLVKSRTATITYQNKRYTVSVQLEE